MNTTESNPAGQSSRAESVDLVRGVVIVLMSLDHVREFFQQEQFDPLDLAQTSVPLFLTRWVTHFCAPVFVLLAGTSAALAIQAGRSRSQIARFLVVRGLWLVFLELTVVRFGMFFNVNYEFSVAQVIWALGCSMILLAPALYLPVWMVTAAGVAIVAFHNLLDGIALPQSDGWGWLWTVLFVPGQLPIERLPIFVAYPVLPWAGVMFAGYGLGELFRKPAAVRRRSLLWLGCLLTMLFIGLRAVNVYGEPRPWSSQATWVSTVLSFLNCTKYPPSLAFVLMTQGPALVLLGWCERPSGTGNVGRFFITFGRVPLFFYIVHFPMIHALALGLTFAQTGQLPEWLLSFPPGHAGPGCGVTLPVLYLVWAAVVAMHYPLCIRFGRLKRRYPGSLLRFL